MDVLAASAAAAAAGAGGGAADALRPSVFELAAAGAVQELLAGAAHYASAVVAAAVPSRTVLRLQRRFDELLAIAALAAHIVFLTGASATCPEAIYGLKRVSRGITSSRNIAIGSLPHKTVLRAAIVSAILLGYLRRKLAHVATQWAATLPPLVAITLARSRSLIEKDTITNNNADDDTSNSVNSSVKCNNNDNVNHELNEEQGDQDPNSNLNEVQCCSTEKTIIARTKSTVTRTVHGIRVAWRESPIAQLLHADPILFAKVATYRVVYPVVESAISSGNAILQVLYALGVTDCYSVDLLLSGTVLRRLDADDMRLLDDLGPLPGLGANPESRLSRAAKQYPGLARTLRAATSALKYALPAVVFSIRFLEWYYASDYFARSQQRPIPPPPRLKPPALGVTIAEDGTRLVPVKLPRDPELCPLCQQKRTNTTVLTCSGYLFCYPCIFRHVESTHHCPVSLERATTSDLRKIYL